MPSKSLDTVERSGSRMQFGIALSGVSYAKGLEFMVKFRQYLL